MPCEAPASTTFCQVQDCLDDSGARQRQVEHVPSAQRTTEVHARLQDMNLEGTRSTHKDDNEHGTAPTSPVEDKLLQLLKLAFCLMALEFPNLDDDLQHQDSSAHGVEDHPSRVAGRKVHGNTRCGNAADDGQGR